MKKDVNDIKIKVGDKFELGPDQDMWKDNLSNVFLRVPGLAKVSRPKDTDYRTQLEWMQANKFKFNNNQKDNPLYFEDEGLTWFEVTEDMDVANIKKAIKFGTLVKKGKSVRNIPKPEPKNQFTTLNSGHNVYDGPHKKLYSFLQKNKTRDLLTIIKKLKDPKKLEIILDFEKKGWNPSAAPRGEIIEVIEKQLDKYSVGMGNIEETENEIETI